MQTHMTGTQGEVVNLLFLEMYSDGIEEGKGK